MIVKSTDPVWGPFAKKYPGISRVLDEARGVRWDCSVFPGLYRGPVAVPCHLWESAFAPAWAAPDRSAHAYAFEFPAWAAGARAEVAYRAVSPTTAEFCAELSGGPDQERRFSLHLACARALPWVERRVPLSPPVRLQLRRGDHWIAGTAYQRLTRTHPHLREELPYDAVLPGECAAGGAVGGFALSWAQDLLVGVRVHYRAPDGAAGKMGFARLRLPGVEPVSLIIRRSGEARSLRIEPDPEWNWFQITNGTPLTDGEELTLAVAGESPLELNGLVLTAARTPPKVLADDWSAAPLESELLAPHARIFRLGGPDDDAWFGVGWHGAEGRWRDVFADDLEAVLPHATHDHVSPSLAGKGDGVFAAAFLPCVTARPGASARIEGVFCHGSRAEVETALRRSLGQPNAFPLAKLLAAHGAAAPQADAFDESGAPEALAAPGAPDTSDADRARARLQATLLTNIVYPVRRFGRFIRHRCPGKWWDSLYTWDSGMIGLGLLEIDPTLAIETLDHYLCPPHEPAAFVHHGSLVPTQMWLAHEIWNRTRDLAWLRRVLPALRRYYHFFSGRGAGSTLAGLGSGLLRPWDYFYNSGGWDDYPPQKHLWSAGQPELLGRVAPVATTAFALLFARQLGALEAIAFPRVGRRPTPPDGIDLEADVRRFTAALGRAHDPQSGFFGYLVHDEDGRPQGLLRHASGENFNLGLDGALPLVAGACNRPTATRLIAALFDPARLWTPHGLRAVDRSASYHSEDGYWNGMIWLPYQWLFFKSLLDRGEAVLAVRLARAAAAVFARSAAETGRCYEHFIPANGQGAGWHHFGGLSAPWMALDGALRRPGTLTAGLDLRILADETARSGERRVDFRRSLVDEAATLLLVTATPPLARLGRSRLEVEDHGAGVWSIRLPAGADEGRIVWS
jgi:hypothetical protein